MAKPKVLHKQSKPKKKREQALETADDYLAAGVDHEEAAGKWRAGDAAKSLRFFVRAIEVYDAGLGIFPKNLDLSYNKARVQLEIATHPILLSQLQEPLQDLLQQALISHRRALELDQDNADTLFNTAQVLTALAEAYVKVDNIPHAESLALLEQALELQTRSFAIQELKYDESQQQQNDAEAQVEQEEVDVMQPPADTSESEEDKESLGEQWFSVVEPVTEETLVDTALAQLATLTTQCSILSSMSESVPGSTLGWVEETSSNILNHKLPRYLPKIPDKTSEVALARANLASGLLEAAYHLETLDATTYKRERDAAFNIDNAEMTSDFAFIEANARSLMAFTSALADGPRPQEQLLQRWTALSQAVKLLATASRMPQLDSQMLARAHFLRGDCSLLQYSMSLPPVSYLPASSSAGQLLQNGEIFYRNAAKLMSIGIEKEVAQFRSTFATQLQSTDMISAARHLLHNNTKQDWARSQLEDMAEEGIIPQIPANF